MSETIKKNGMRILGADLTSKKCDQLINFKTYGVILANDTSKCLSGWVLLYYKEIYSNLG